MPTWDTFMCRVLESFGDPHKVEKAQRGLHVVTQGQRTAKDFFIHFEDLKYNACFCDKSFIFELKRALRKEFQEEVSCCRPTPTNYCKWKVLILQVDQDLQESSAANTYYAPSPSFCKYSSFLFRPSNITNPQTSSNSNQAPITSLVAKPAVGAAYTPSLSAPKPKFVANSATSNDNENNDNNNDDNITETGENDDDYHNNNNSYNNDNYNNDGDDDVPLSP
ncbi:hypothetical protein B0H34DRAFT_794793 [Crassisporium funariophilum]|nr:hypothetical protein B0H34DRAFT_794793 [Crassisporium funariophilum]